MSRLIQHLVPYSTSAIMALVWQMCRLLLHPPNVSSCFIKFFKLFIYIFETSGEYIHCEIISADDIASGEVVRYKRLV